MKDTEKAIKVYTGTIEGERVAKAGKWLDATLVEKKDQTLVCDTTEGIMEVHITNAFELEAFKVFERYVAESYDTINNIMKPRELGITFLVIEKKCTFKDTGESSLAKSVYNGFGACYTLISMI